MNNEPNEQAKCICGSDEGGPRLDVICPKHDGAVVAKVSYSEVSYVLSNAPILDRNLPEVNIEIVPEIEY